VLEYEICFVHKFDCACEMCAKYYVRARNYVTFRPAEILRLCKTGKYKKTETKHTCTELWNEML